MVGRSCANILARVHAVVPHVVRSVCPLQGLGVITVVIGGYPQKVGWVCGVQLHPCLACGCRGGSVSVGSKIINLVGEDGHGIEDIVGFLPEVRDLACPDVINICPSGGRFMIGGCTNSIKLGRQA
jgi:hypothetical protein